MIRAALRYVAAPLLGRLGAAEVHAAREALDDADAAHLNEARAIGERDEARYHCAHLLSSLTEARASAASAHDSAIAAWDEHDTATREIATLRSELDSAAADDEALANDRAALADVRTERDELKRHNMRLVADIGNQSVRIRGLEEQLDARADVVPVKDAGQTALSSLFASSSASVAPCGWCLGPSEESGSYGATVDDRWVRLCKADAVNAHPSITDLEARVALRARCCATRRTSANPLDVVCTLGCGAEVGEECAAGRVDVG